MGGKKDLVSPTLDFTHGRQEGPCFYKILKINVVLLIIDSIDG
jgi:hypothetical protein